MDRNARRRLRYIEKKLDAYVEELAAAGEDADWIGRLIEEVPIDEHRAARLWEVLRSRRRPVSLSAVGPASGGKATYLMNHIDFAGELSPHRHDETYLAEHAEFLGRPGSGKSSSAGLFFAQSIQSYPFNVLDIDSRSPEEEARIGERFIRQSSRVPDPQ